MNVNVHGENPNSLLRCMIDFESIKLNEEAITCEINLLKMESSSSENSKEKKNVLESKLLVHGLNLRLVESLAQCSSYESPVNCSLQLMGFRPLETHFSVSVVFPCPLSPLGSHSKSIN